MARHARAGPPFFAVAIVVFALALVLALQLYTGHVPAYYWTLTFGSAIGAPAIVGAVCCTYLRGMYRLFGSIAIGMTWPVAFALCLAEPWMAASLWAAYAIAAAVVYKLLDTISAEETGTLPETNAFPLLLLMMQGFLYWPLFVLAAARLSRPRVSARL